MKNATEQQVQSLQIRSKSSIFLFVVALLVTASALVGFLGIGAAAPKSVTAAAGKVTIAVAGLNDGQAHFFSYNGQNGKIPFFVIKGSDGTIHAAFDACDVCYQEKKGYQQQGEQMICKNCNQAFPVAKIGTVSGGCNPSPLKFTLTGASLEIAISDLESGARYF